VSNLKNNKSENKNVNNNNMKKKIYINPVDFQNFCKEIEEKLNI
jgi:tRNA1(Val) A37 N6-methylase TrmN6